MQELIYREGQLLHRFRLHGEQKRRERNNIVKYIRYIRVEK